ncbi:hypothetical protein [Marinagarivorans algicola]|uniref:hypothetical protein n=1 Tax=Marinagarivorans algicola TaxID=1513270 RepID=UPI0037365D75
MRLMSPPKNIILTSTLMASFFLSACGDDNDPTAHNSSGQNSSEKNSPPNQEISSRETESSSNNATSSAPAVPPNNTTADGPFQANTDPSCSDGRYTEELPDVSADIDHLINDFYALDNPTTEQMAQVQLDVFDIAYPHGAYILRNSPGFDGAGRCDLTFSDVEKFGTTSPWNFAIHECGHALDFERDTYFLSSNYETPIPTNDYFGRGEITKDRFHNDIPDAFANSTYFEDSSAKQGIHTTYSEWSQYTHSVAVNYLLWRFPKLEYDFDTRAMLNFMWAAQRYWLWAKEQRPQDYTAMLNDEKLREATLLLWGQSWLYYDALGKNTTWQETDKHLQYINAMKRPELLAVLNEVRIKHGCIGL